MKAFTRIARRLSKTATLGAVALALAVGGTLALTHAVPADRLGGDRLLKMDSAAGGGSGCLERCGASPKDGGLVKSGLLAKEGMLGTGPL